MTTATTHPSRNRSLVTALLVLGCPTLVLLAVGAELLAGQYSNSEATGWELVFPLSWPQPARVGWWLLIAAAAGGFRYGLHLTGLRQRAWVVVASVAPFVVFAGGIAVGASFSTWH